ncbi:MAG: sulfurtransferase complex subunit TusC [Gammaproteobacteria bacterium]|nr:sulfurtransferase complex subunit TusC [Gammaproteobacteria bacterium]
MATKAQTFIFLSRSAPYGSHRSQLCLDAVLAAAVFEQTVHYIFLDDGVYQLLKEQDASAINRKTLGKTLQSLELYGVNQVYVDGESLNYRGLGTQDLLLPATEINAPGIRLLLRNADHVFNL